MSTEDSGARVAPQGRRIVGRGLSVETSSGSADDVFKPSPLLRKLDSLEIGKAEAASSDKQLPSFLGGGRSSQPASAPRVGGRITPPTLSPVLPRSNSGSSGRAVESPRSGLSALSPRSDSSPKLSPLQSSGSQTLLRSQSGRSPSGGSPSPVSARGPSSSSSPNSGVTQITDITELDQPSSGKTSPTAPPKLNIAAGSRPLSSGRSSASASDWPPPTPTESSRRSQDEGRGKAEPRKTTSKLSGLADAPKLGPRGSAKFGGDDDYEPDADWWPDDNAPSKLASLGPLPKMGQRPKSTRDSDWPS
eukprot:TRINITY_DN26986_c0_g1_i1.p1 TRINITY_DN26986_c0_g1~~TRINITY_DN26986_c0_g1_i1.p1  ORF type:complete len:305 (-),score=95.18 TRINITY_DN26986_c0_g1_i1:324-1238(-)